MINVETITIYKRTSLDKSSKGCSIALHSLEPIGIELTSAKGFNVTISGDNITGFSQLFIHDTGNVRGIQTINANTKTYVNTTTLGGIFFYIDTIKYSVNNNVPFSFKITLELDSTSYVINPIFDIRKQKISDNYMEQSAFQNKVIDASNAEYGMLMISDNIRIYMPKSKYIPKSFNAMEVLNLIEDIYRIYNKLNGLDNNTLNITPRVDFLLASARTEHVGYGSASGTMMDTGPETSYFYMGPGWGLYHECGHMFEGNWAVIEVWTNMFSKFMEDRLSSFSWLWGNDRTSYENNNIKSFYENYLALNKNSEFGLDFGTGLYFFISLEQALGANFTPKTELYAKLNSIPTVGYKYVIYSVAKNFGLNAIPYGEIYGQYINDNNIINDIIDSSSGTLLYIPENSNFNAYRNISAPVTVKLLYIENPILEGISNPNAIININTKNNNYQMNTDKYGKFSFKIPITMTVKDIVTVDSTETGKVKSLTKYVYPVNHLVDSSIVFYGLGYFGYSDPEIASITFNVNENKLVVKSSGVQANLRYGTSEYFGVALQDGNGNTNVDIGVIGNDNANVFSDTLNNKTFNYGDVIIVRAIEARRVYIANYNDQKYKYNPQKNPEGFKIKEKGLYPQFEYSTTEVIFRGVGDFEVARIKFNTTIKVLEVTSTGKQAHLYFGSQEYFAVEMLDENKASIVRAGVIGTSNANSFRDALNNKAFKENYSLVLSYKERTRVIITNYSGASAYNPAASSETFMFNSTGLI